MNSEARAYLKKHIESFMDKFPNSTTQEVYEWIESGELKYDFSQINKKTFRNFISYQRQKYSKYGQVQKHIGGNGRPVKITPRVKARAKKLMMNKTHRSLRSVAATIGIHHTSVRNIMKSCNAKAYHKCKEQKMTDKHKASRVKFSKELLGLWGDKITGFSKFKRLINTDFSAKIKLHPSRNSKNDIVWSGSRESASSLLGAPEEKFSAGVMVWGGVSYRGLVPAAAPVFCDEFLAEYDPVPKSMNGDRYADLIREKAGPAVLQLYPAGNAIWQDDPATIHRCAAAIKACDETFKFHLPHKTQAPKCADIWPIENVWAIIKQDLAQVSVTTIPEMKKQIIKVWQKINADKELCHNLIASIPRRLKAVIEKKGSQVSKKDYH